MKLQVSKRAAAQLQTAIDWWRENRGLAPRMLEEEAEQAFTALKATPFVGIEARDVRTRGVRRLYLSKTQHFVYYRVDEKFGEVVVLRFWHTSRGRPPKL